MLEVTSAVLVFLTCGLIRWTCTQPEPSSRVLLACQRASKKIHLALIARLEKKRDPRSAARHWKDDGLRLHINLRTHECKKSSRYMHETRKIFAEERIVELALDATMLATRDTQISIACACHTGVAAYSYDIRLQSPTGTCRARQADPGDIVNDEDFERFEQQGWHTLADLDGQDCVRSINHVLQTGLGKDISSFKPEEALVWMPVGGVRY